MGSFTRSWSRGFQGIKSWEIRWPNLRWRDRYGSGLLTKNDQQLHQGKEKLADVVQTTVTSIGETFSFAQEQVTEAYEGGKEMDGQRLNK